MGIVQQLRNDHNNTHNKTDEMIRNGQLARFTFANTAKLIIFQSTSEELQRPIHIHTDDILIFVLRILYSFGIISGPSGI